ncbi:MAG: DUF2723 domain-containing protein [Gemmatimonadetes bacterium]|nr:DUF2723 domain-containing protein [Gemmatimonadota bacterium]
MNGPRPPYLAAAATAILVLVGYVVSLAPSVTFWDAGEFIAAMKVLGIPHPPGTPLFVMIGHVWAKMIPFGEYAWRTNLMSAVFSAAAAGFWFLTLHEALARGMPGDGTRDRLLRTLAAGAGAIIGAFTFTNWQNSNETEVYGIAGFIVAASAWLACRWRASRGDPRSPRFLLMIAYLLGLSIANHLLALLAGPAILAYLGAVVLGDPAADPAARRRELAKVVVMGGLWALLLGVGLGSGTLATLGLVLFVASAIYAATAGALSFATLAVVIALVGATPYLFLYLRSPQNPVINEAAPGTWDALLAVIRRDQYPPRSPLDDPTVPHGPDNPGRSLTIIGLQLLNYLQYFDWQWAKSLVVQAGNVPLRAVVTIAFFWLGLTGLRAHRRADRPTWWLMLALWVATGLGLMAYMNFRPGFSVGYQQFPDSGDHEVRERDYFFVLSFVVWAGWVGMGLLELAKRLRHRVAAVAVFAVAAVPVVGNFRDADRGNGPDARLAGDWAYSLLNSVPPNGILFTFGDNDTFPLWWAQEVEGIRRDVRIVCLALTRTDWYTKQLRDLPDRPFEPDKAPAFWRGYPTVEVTWPVHTMTDQEIAAAVPQILPRAVALQFGPYRTQLDSNSVVYTEDIVAIRTIQQNFGRRPIAWGLSSGGKYFGLDGLIVQRGIGMHLETAVPDSSNRRLAGGLFGVPVDIVATDSLANHVYRYADLLARPQSRFESTAAGMANTMSLPFVQLGYQAQATGDLATAVASFERALRVFPNPGVQDLLRQIRQPKLESDTTLPQRQ